jgi:hypothetical protein
MKTVAIQQYFNQIRYRNTKRRARSMPTIFSVPRICANMEYLREAFVSKRQPSPDRKIRLLRSVAAVGYGGWV